MAYVFLFVTQKLMYSPVIKQLPPPPTTQLDTSCLLPTYIYSNMKVIPMTFAIVSPPQVYSHWWSNYQIQLSSQNQFVVSHTNSKNIAIMIKMYLKTCRYTRYIIQNTETICISYIYKNLFFCIIIVRAQSVQSNYWFFKNYAVLHIKYRSHAISRNI